MKNYYRKIVLITCLVCLFFLSKTLHAETKDLTTKNGKEISLLADDGKRFKIKIQVIKVPQGFLYSEGWGWGADEQSNLKYVIKIVKAWWGEEKVFVPLSAYSDLANPNEVFLNKEGKEIHFVIKGGDAGTSYKAVLIFEKGMIRSRKVVHGEFPDEAWEETKYSFNELDN